MLYFSKITGILKIFINIISLAPVTQELEVVQFVKIVNFKMQKSDNYIELGIALVIFIVQESRTTSKKITSICLRYITGVKRT